MHCQAVKASNKPVLHRKLLPLSVAFILSAATCWATLLPDPQFAAPVSNAFGLPYQGSSYSTSSLVDLDGDGDLDFVVDNVPMGSVNFCRNTGSAAAPAFAAPIQLFSVPSLYAFSTFGDIDGDGDLDALVGTYHDGLYFFRNTGNSTAHAFAPRVVNPFGLFPFPFQQRLDPELANIDGDGDFDLIVGTLYTGVTLFRNTGSSTSPAFSSDQVPGCFGISPFNNGSMASTVDIEGDGDLDAFLGALTINKICFHRNIGNSTSPSFGEIQMAPFGMVPADFGWAATLGDLDDDGDLDMITVYNGIAPGNLFMYWQNTAPVDTTPPAVTITRNGDTTTASDTVTFAVQFNEPVGNSFTSADISTTGGSLATSALLVTPSPADPNYTVTATLSNPDIGGTIGIQVSSSVMDIYENPMSSSTASSLFTITPPGDVNLSGKLDLADVALLADVNLGLATLP